MQPACTFSTQAGLRAQLAVKPGHGLYPFENNTQTANALLSILYTVSRGAPFSPDAPVAVRRTDLLVCPLRDTKRSSRECTENIPTNRQSSGPGGSSSDQPIAALGSLTIENSTGRRRRTAIASAPASRAALSRSTPLDVVTRSKLLLLLHYARCHLCRIFRGSSQSALSICVMPNDPSPTNGHYSPPVQPQDHANRPKKSRGQSGRLHTSILRQTPTGNSNLPDKLRNIEDLSNIYSKYHASHDLAPAMLLQNYSAIPNY